MLFGRYQLLLPQKTLINVTVNVAAFRAASSYLKFYKKS